MSKSRVLQILAIAYLGLSSAGSVANANLDCKAALGGTRTRAQVATASHDELHPPDLLPERDLARPLNTNVATRFFAKRFIHEFSIEGRELRSLPLTFAALLFDANSLGGRQLRIIDAFFKGDHLSNPFIRKSVEAVIGRRISDRENVAVRIARIFDRDLDLMGQTSRASEAFYANAKIRALSLAGFSVGERARLMSSEVMRDDHFSEARFSFDHQANDVRTQDILNQNTDLIIKAANWKNSQPTPGRTAAISEIEARRLLRELTNHPVTRYERRHDYDPDGSRGFCYGRAFAGHLLALEAGIDKNSIRKVFVAGPLKTKDGMIWSFHVAVMVANTSGGFWVLDPNYLEPQTLKNWYKTYEAQSIDQRVRLFITPPSRFAAEGFAAYQSETLGHPFYNHYFDDLLSLMRDQNEAFRSDLSPRGAP